MRRKNNSKKRYEEIDVDSLDKDLEAKIDAMLDPRAPDKPVEQPAVHISDTPQVVDDTPRLDIFKDAKTAPELTTVTEDKDENPENAEHTEVPPSDLVETTPPLAEPEAVTEPDTEETKVASVPTPNDKQPTKTSKLARIRQWFARWWRNKTARYTTIAVAFVLIIGVLAWPTSRYFLLNTAGVRSGASLSVVDDTTGLPLKNVSVVIGSSKATTDAQGHVKFSGLKLGKQELQISRVAFASLETQLTLGWGSNRLGEHVLRATGAQYQFGVKDYLSDKPITKAEVTSDTASAFADEEGKIILTVDDPGQKTLAVTITAAGYRTEKLDIDVKKTEPTKVAMVSSQPVVYISKQSGTYDVFKIDADGKNKKMLLAGTGLERDNLVLLAGPAGKYAALVSSRENKRDSEGYLLDTLTLINMQTGEARTIDHAQNIRLVEWRGTKLAYRAAYAAPSAATNERQRIVVYDVEDSARAVLKKGNYFNGIVGINGYIYYIVNSPGTSDGLFGRVRLDGSGSQTIIGERSRLLVRTGIDTLHIQTEKGWHTYNVTRAKLENSGEPANYRDRTFAASPAGTATAWVDIRDGQGVLLVRDNETDKETAVISARGLGGPIQWLGADTLSYYVDSGTETAVYVVSLDGGSAHKLSSATLVQGITAVH